MRFYLQLFWVFFKIGAFTFGGGYAMIPLIQREVVNKRKWLEEGEFMDMLAIAQSVPGPISLNTPGLCRKKTQKKPGQPGDQLGNHIAVVYCHITDCSGIYRI